MGQLCLHQVGTAEVYTVDQYHSSRAGGVRCQKSLSTNPLVQYYMWPPTYTQLKCDGYMYIHVMDIYLYIFQYINFMVHGTCQVRYTFCF